MTKRQHEKEGRKAEGSFTLRRLLQGGIRNSVGLSVDDMKVGQLLTFKE